MSVGNVSGCIEVKGASVYGVVNAHAIKCVIDGEGIPSCW